MASQQAIRILLLTGGVLLVAVAVTAGAYAIAAGAHDALGARVLWWLVVAGLVLLTIDANLLLGALALRELQRPEEEE